MESLDQGKSHQNSIDSTTYQIKLNKLSTYECLFVCLGGGVAVQNYSGSRYQDEVSSFQ